MIIKILGSGCKNCQILAERTQDALDQLSLVAKIEKVTDFADIASYGVMKTPGLVLDEKVISAGRVLEVEEIKKLIIIKENV